MTHEPSQMVDGAWGVGLSGMGEVGTDTYLGSHTGGVIDSHALLSALAGKYLGSKTELDAKEGWDRVGSDFRGAQTACKAGGTGGGGTGKELCSSWWATSSYMFVHSGLFTEGALGADFEQVC